MREQGVALEDHPDVALVGREAGDLRGADADLTRVGLDEPGNHAEGGGLAAPARPEQGDELAGAHVEGDRVDRDDVVVRLDDVA